MSILQLHGVSRSFGGVRAVEDASFTVERGQLFGIIGPNGAGKTTLLNLISGLINPDAGRITLNGIDTTKRTPQYIARHGLARTYQTIRLFDTMSVRENVMVGGHSALSYSFLAALSRRKIFKQHELALIDHVDFLLDTVGLADRSNDPAISLSYGEQRRLELARALAAKPAILMLDEPAAGMNTRESENLSNLLRRLVDTTSLTVVIIEHNVRLMMELCDRIVVMNFGRKLKEGTPAEVRKDPSVIQAYLGRAA